MKRLRMLGELVLILCLFPLACLLQGLYSYRDGLRYWLKEWKDAERESRTRKANCR